MEKQDEIFKVTTRQSYRPSISTTSTERVTTDTQAAPRHPWNVYSEVSS